MIKLRNTLFLVIILLLASCSLPEEEGRMTEASFMQILSEKTSSPVCAFFYMEDAEEEDSSAFAFTGELSTDRSGTVFEGALWYVNAQGGLLLQDHIKSTEFEPVMIENGRHLLFSATSALSDESCSYIWAVDDQKPVLLLETSGFCFMDNGLLAMVRTSLGNQAGGRIWQRYYLYWDQDKHSYEVYMGRELTSSEFLSYEHAWEARAQVESAIREVTEQTYRIGNGGADPEIEYEYIQCDNGIIYVNYIMSYGSDVYYNYAIMREKEGTVFLEERNHYDTYEKGRMYENDDFYITDNWAGCYSHYSRTLEDGYVNLSLILYSDEGIYSGYLNLDGKEKAEGEEEFSWIQDRILVDIIDDRGEIHVYFKERLVEDTKRGELFGHYQSGDLLFSLKREGDEIIATWQSMQFHEQEADLKRGFVKRDEIYGLKLLNETDRTQYLKAVGMATTSPIYRYFNDEGDLQLELFYHMTRRAGVGIYYDRYQGQLTMKPFDVGSWIAETWFDDRYSLPDGEEEKHHFDQYDEEHIYNEEGQLTYYCSTGMVPGWKVPVMGKLVEMEFTYREDGTLQKKDSSFNSRAYFNPSLGGTFYYDEQERLRYATGYITHGHLEYYYIYEEGSEVPSYCLGLDHNLDSVSAMYFKKYVQLSDGGGE